MLKIRVRYILVIFIATVLYVVWINLGTGRTLLEVFVRIIRIIVIYLHNEDRKLGKCTYSCYIYCQTVSVT